MCYNIVECVEYRCGHRYPVRRHSVDCNSRQCRRSQYHTPTRHDCARECQEGVRPDVQMVLPSDRQFEPCSLCRNPHPKINGVGGAGRTNAS